MKAILSLVADAVRGRHQHRIAVASPFEVKQGAESAYARQYAGHPGTRGDGTNAPHQFVAGVDTDAGFGVGKSSGGRHGPVCEMVFAGMTSDRSRRIAFDSYHSAESQGFHMVEPVAEPEAPPAEASRARILRV